MCSTPARNGRSGWDIVRPVSAAGRVSDLYRRAEHWWTEDLWASPPAEPGNWVQRLGVAIAKTVYIVVSGFGRERIKLRAAALTYVSLLSLVPALVVFFSLFAAFAGLEQILSALKAYIVQSLAVSQHDIAIEYVERFLQQSKTVGGFGIVVLFVTVISLLENIERAFNDIWGIGRVRSLIHRFQVYWPLVTLGPILLGLSLSLTAAVQTSRAAEILTQSTFVFAVLSKLIPWVFIAVFLTLLYVFLPNTSVPIRYALIGGSIAGLLWELAKQLYAVYASYALARPSIYGSLAAVPLFILWLYVSWVLALLGATITFAAQNASTYEPEGKRDRPRSQRDREFLAARLLLAVSEQFDVGKGAVPEQALVEQMQAPPRFARRVLDELVLTGLLVEAVTAASVETAYVPGRPLRAISIADVIGAMRRGPAAKSDLVIPDHDLLGRKVCEAIVEAERVVEETLGPKTLARLLEEARAPAESETGH